MIGILEEFLRQEDSIKELLDLATVIQGALATNQSSRDLAEVLVMIQSRTNHIRAQLAKGIEIEKQVCDVEEQTKGLNGCNVYIIPWYQEYRQ